MKSSSLIFNSCVEDTSESEVDFKIEGVSIIFGVGVGAKFEFKIEEPGRGSNGGKNPSKGAEEAEAWGFGMRFSTTGCLTLLSATGAPGGAGLAIGFCDFSGDTGVANCRDELADFGAAASADNRGGIDNDGELEEA